MATIWLGLTKLLTFYSSVKPPQHATPGFISLHGLSDVTLCFIDKL